MQPDLPFTMGVLETHDMLLVSDWLQEKPFVRRTGLIGFCWGANIALLTAWQDDGGPNDPDVSPRIAAQFKPIKPRHRYTAGIIAISPALRFEKLLHDLDTPRWFVFNPCLATIQKRIRHWLEQKGLEEPVGSVKQLIEFEYARSELDYPGASDEGLRFLHLVPNTGKPGASKLEHVRMPVLIIHASNDPLAMAQDVADTITCVRNRAVAALILDDGGHVGFAPFAGKYYYSLVTSFFDPRIGAAALPRVTVTASVDQPVEKNANAQ